MLLVGCLTSQQHASVSQGRICSDKFHVLPHWDRSCRPNFPSHPVTVYWHRADQSRHWPCNARRLAGLPLECQFLSHWYDSTPEKSRGKRDSNSGPSALEADALTTRPTRGQRLQKCSRHFPPQWWIRAWRGMGREGRGGGCVDLILNGSDVTVLRWDGKMLGLLKSVHAERQKKRTPYIVLLMPWVLTQTDNNNNSIQRRKSRFFTISSLRRELSPTRTLKWPRRNRVQMTCNASSAYLVQHVVLRATWYEWTAQLLSLTELKSHLFELEIAFIWALFCWLNH